MRHLFHLTHSSPSSSTASLFPTSSLSSPASPFSPPSSSLLHRRFFHPTRPSLVLGPLAAGVAIGLAIVSAKYILEAAKASSSSSGTYQPEDPPQSSDPSPSSHSSSSSSPSPSSSSTPTSTSTSSRRVRVRNTGPSSPTSSSPRTSLEEAIGIDLGLFNSRVSVATLESGLFKNARVVENADGARATPSIVGFQDGEFIFGAAARRQLYTNPASTLLGLKHLIGRKVDDPLAQAVLRTNRVKSGDDGQGGIWVEMGGKKLEVAELLGLYLAKLREGGEEFLGKKVSAAAYALPSSFGDSQLRVLKQASRFAGMVPFAFVPEEQALARAVIEEGEGFEKAMFVDIGASMKVNLVENKNGALKTYLSLFEDQLGGRLFDEDLLLHIVKKFALEKNIDLLLDPFSEQRLREAVEKARCELSTTPQTNINLPYITADAKGPKHLNEDMTRSKFEQLGSSHFSRVEQLLQGALSSTPQEAKPDKIFLVGGLSRTPKMKSLLEELMMTQGREGMELVLLEKAEELAVIGALIAANQQLRG